MDQQHPPDDADPAEQTPPKQILRGGGLVSAPFILVGLVLVAIGSLNLAWTFDQSTTGSALGLGIGFGAAGALALIAARGCRVITADGTVRDQVAFVTVRRVDQGSVVKVRTRSGPWRAFEIESASGDHIVLLGCGPQHFPATLMPDAAQRDLSRIDTISGFVGT